MDVHKGVGRSKWRRQTILEAIGVRIKELLRLGIEGYFCNIIKSKKCIKLERNINSMPTGK